MLTVKRQSNWNISSIILKKIASIGVWGNGRFPQLNLPSALAVAKQGYSFLFAYSGVLIAFIVGLVLHWFCWKCSGLFNWIFNWYRIASRQLKSNLLLSFWQIKNYTLVGKFDFWGCLTCLLKWVFSIYYKCCCDTLWHIQKTMKILFLFWVGALECGYFT